MSGSFFFVCFYCLNSPLTCFSFCVLFCLLLCLLYLFSLNCISHFLSSIPYQDLTPQASILPPRKHCQDYVRPPMAAMKWVPDKYV